MVKWISAAVDIIDQLVDDGDLNQKLKAQLYLAELQTPTIPWIDGIHKLGRQFLALAQVGFYAWCVKTNTPITPELVAGVSGTSAVYTLLKGKGS